MNSLILSNIFCSTGLVDALLWFLYINIGIAIFTFFATPFVASYCVYCATLRRRKPEKWSRNPKNLEGNSLIMDKSGMAWYEENKQYKQDVHIVNEGLNLYGQYFDFGYDRCAFILSGRTESLRYGYYFAQCYYKEGWNILVFDPRAHGLSDGEFNTVGFEESKDTLAWAKFIHETYGMKAIYFHGICIGSAGGLYVLTRDDCPDYIVGMTADGMFANFGESMKNHIIEMKKPLFPAYWLINRWMKHFTGHTMDVGPIDVIHKLKKPLLMLYSKEDNYSVPEFAQKLFDLAGSETKELVWFDHGAHSMLRVTDTEKYDRVIHEYMSKNFSRVETK